MTRRLATLLVLAAATLPAGGCAVSLFSKEEARPADDERLSALERRMVAVERALPKP
jgi:hypothetical protein